MRYVRSMSRSKRFNADLSFTSLSLRVTGVSLPIAVTSGVAWRVFSATSLMDARYAQGSVISVGRNVDISGNEVESAPRLIARAGLSARGRRGDVTAQLSHVSRTYADALNTVAPSATGAVGRVPAYTVADLNGSYVCGLCHMPSRAGKTKKSRETEALAA